jgi:hypothetical protein
MGINSIAGGDALNGSTNPATLTITADTVVSASFTSSTVTSKGNLYIHNYSSHTIYYLYVVQKGASSWGTDQLGSKIIPSGTNFTLMGITPGSYDIRAESSGRTYYWQEFGVYIGTSGFTWSLY